MPDLSYGRPYDCPRSLSPPEAAGGHAGALTARQGSALVVHGLQAHDLDAARSAHLSPLPALHLGRYRGSADPAFCVEADLDPDPGEVEPDAGRCGPGPIGG